MSLTSCVCVCVCEREREVNDFIYGALYEFFTFSLWLLILKNILVFCAEVRYNVCVVLMATSLQRLLKINVLIEEFLPLCCNCLLAVLVNSCLASCE